VLKLLAHGLTDREIAQQLIVSPHTVHRHVANIRHKLGRGSRTAASPKRLAWAALNGSPYGA
jgi:DNA-binding NarL/FixJ family response regulator